MAEVSRVDLPGVDLRGSLRVGDDIVRCAFSHVLPPEGKLRDLRDLFGALISLPDIRCEEVHYVAEQRRVSAVLVGSTRALQAAQDRESAGGTLAALGTPGQLTTPWEVLREGYRVQPPPHEDDPEWSAFQRLLVIRQEAADRGEDVQYVVGKSDGLLRQCLGVDSWRTLRIPTWVDVTCPADKILVVVGATPDIYTASAVHFLHVEAA